MNVERINEHLRPSPVQYVTVKEMGNITEVRFMTNEMGAVIRKIDRNTYRNLITGQVLEYKHGTSRVDSVKNIAQSLKRLREIINTNVTDTKKCLWATLTYAENMTDHKRLYEDYRRFNMRFQRYLQKNNLPSCEYIACAEPQERRCVAFTYYIYI